MGMDFYLAQPARTWFAFWFSCAIADVQFRARVVRCLGRTTIGSPAPYSTGYNFGAANVR